MMTLLTSVACQVWLSGFLSGTLEPDSGVVNGINDLARDCRECRVFTAEESVGEIAAADSEGLRESLPRAKARKLLMSLDLNDA